MSKDLDAAWVQEDEFDVMKPLVPSTLYGSPSDATPKTEDEPMQLDSDTSVTPGPAGVSATSKVTVDVRHFYAPRPQREKRDHTRRAPPVGQSSIYTDVNPATSQRLLRQSNKLELSDASDRSYWDACDSEYNRINAEEVERLKEQFLYGDGNDMRCILVAANKNKRDGLNHYNVFIGSSDELHFETRVGPDGRLISKGEPPFLVKAHIIHTTAYEPSYKARSTCYMVLSGGFEYTPSSSA